ncbi:hypothetical protein DSC91_002593 [Paraburkholderia caffeinilytica]|uniref:DUF2300 domain-containing protein n=1 Tax=Paraburkholderia caffeinilytica TaxID=1761016 RepID=UPI000E20FF01|nr:DUF2300 domain-containing protein [Paraburkholderia caffeinilytica]AXL50403.1 hypothetical protein DSC91_002593 [Paraburkholderia caffeinilytica]CAB3790770.1 hypothetical protein LMG28690_03170 [Paraburkholderia caffeinilytica]
MFSVPRHSRDRLAATLRIALAVGAGCVFSGAGVAAAMASSTASFAVGARSTSTTSPISSSAASSALHFAWLRDGQAQLWQFNAGGTSDGVTQQSAQPLQATLETPLGSVWKLFVYGYLVDRNIATPDYTCSGGDPEEVYCCMTGGHIDREHALVQSCGRFFEPARLQLDPADWRRYWTAAHAPAWLRDLHAMTPTRRVPVIDVLAALQTMPAKPREAAASTLVSVLTSGRGEGTVSLYGSLLRAKTWTMPDPARPGASIGGAAGWLADGTPVWLGGPGGSARVLAVAAPRIAPLLTQVAVPDDNACVLVDFFSRYPIRQVLGDKSPAAVPDGPLRGAFRIGFVNGNWARVESRGELRLDRDAAGAPQVVGRFGMNDYVARVVEREGDTSQPEAAKVLAVAARSYVVQHGNRDHGCFRIDDSSSTQRVLPRPPTAAARRAADLTDALVLTGVPVQYHHDKAAPGQMSWLAAKAAAQTGLTFDSILSRTWPQATLTSFESPLSGDCLQVAGAQQWLQRNAPLWARRMDGAAGYETPDLPAVCAVREGRPYADAQRNRVYVYRLQTEEDRIALAHEYIHLAFQHHPRGLDEEFVERTARTLIRTDNPIQ